MEKGELMVPSGKLRIGEFLAKLRMLASAEGFDESMENRNAVQVSGLRASYLMRYEYVFIVGLIDGDIPFLAAGNAFVRDREAAKMGLLTKRDMLRQERFYFLSSLLSSDKKAYVSRGESDGSAALVPSYFFTNLESAFDLDEFERPETIGSTLCAHRAVGELISKRREPAEIGVDLPVPLPELCHRITVECDERSGGYHSPFDGIFFDTETIENLNKMMAKRDIFSPSALETYARCPFSYYVSYLMGIRPFSEIEEGLTPAERGTLFHHIAYRFYSELRAGGSTRFSLEHVDVLSAKINRIAEEEMARYPLTGPLWQAFQASMLGTHGNKGVLRAFLEKEATNASRITPAYFELSFGLPIDGGEVDPASKTSPVEIDLGGEKLKLRCRIDRVDATPDGRFTVIDYKTGASAPSVSSIEKGLALQLPLYIQAVEAAMGGMRGIGGACYSVRSEAEIEHKCVFGDKDYEVDLKPYLGDKRFKEGFSEIIQGSNGFIKGYLSSMRAGRFTPNNGQAPCPNGCDFGLICRHDPIRLEEDNHAPD
jgi:ATP-dependent helicase/DNAse subunit B